MLNQLKDVFKSLQKHNVHYLIIGGIAAILHGVPRTTFDLDLLIEATQENAHNLLDALMDANLGTATLTSADDLLAHEITIFQDRVRIDIQIRTPGLDFSKAWEKKMMAEVQGVKIFLVAKEDLIASKKAAGREIDLEDIRLLTLDDPGS